MNDTLTPPPSSPPPISPETPPPPAPPAGRRVNPWTVIGAVLAAFVVVQGAGWIIAVIGRQSDTQTAQTAARPRLVVHLDSGDVRVRADAAADEAGVFGADVRRSWTLKEPRLHWTTSADTVELDVDCGYLWVGWCIADLDLRVPAGTALQVRTDSGDVEAAGLRQGADLQTDSGAVTARGITGATRMSTDSGDLTIDDVTGDLALETDSGSIDVVDASASEVRAHTDSGRIRIDLATDPRRVTATTDSGGVEVRLPDTPGVAYLLDLDTDSGSTAGQVRTDPASQHAVTARTDSGDVSVSYR